MKLLLAACLALALTLDEAAADVARFGLFLIKTPHADLDKIELEAKPLLTENDFTSYDGGTHAMTLTDAGRAKLPSVTKVGVRGRGFVIMANGGRCYRGAFWISASSINCPTPVILVDEGCAGNLIHIRRAYPTDKFAEGPDPRGDERLLKVLRELGKLATLPTDFK